MMERKRSTAVAISDDLRIVDELRRLEDFAGDDPQAAESAFVQLSERVRRFLWKYLATTTPKEADREDVIAIVLEKLYAKRCEFQVRSVGQWWSYVSTVGKRTAWDQAKKPEEQLDEELPERDVEFIGNVAEMSHFQTRLYRLADEFWLKVPSDLPESDRKRRLLAAQLFYLHGAPYAEVCEILGRNKPLDRETLDEWLSDPSVLMDLAYSELYLGNDELLSNLLSPEHPLSGKELNAVVRASDDGSSEPPSGWTWEEIRIARWRYLNGLLDEKIQQISPGLTQKKIDATLAKCKASQLYERIARGIQNALRKRRVALDPLSKTELWRRLVFQYSICHELPHKQILERTESAARVADFNLTAAMLNGWLSSGRLVSQLAAYTKEEK